MSSEYATLEEAFGVASFLAPEPPILRGDVNAVYKERHTKNFNAPGMKRLAELHRAKNTQSSMTQPREVSRKQLVSNSKECLKTKYDAIAAAHAAGGAAAAWDLVPASARSDMMWHAVKELVDTDVLLMTFLGIALIMLLR